MDKEAMLKLANVIEACCEDAVRRNEWGGYNVTQQPDVRIICLANGMKAIAAAIRAQVES